jgi:hypothetical protein
LFAAPEPDGLTLPPGFHATVVAEGLGSIRHLALRGNGNVYVSTPQNQDPSKSGIIALHLDANHSDDAKRLFNRSRSAINHLEVGASWPFRLAFALFPMVETIREMRHQATSVIIASQDPLSVPRAIMELTSVLILHRMTSPQWLKHLRSAIVSLNDVQDAAVTSLLPGEALV